MFEFYRRSGIIFMYDGFNTAFMPYFFAMIAISFVLLIVCMLLFYKREMAFRTLFVIESAVMILGMILFYMEGQDGMFYFVAGDSWALMIAMRITITASMHVAIVPSIAFIIALFKSQRVKNTFS